MPFNQTYLLKDSGRPYQAKAQLCFAAEFGAF